jgi:SAM-dependent methyltransferase
VRQANRFRKLAKRRLPARLARWIRRRHLTVRPPVGGVRLGGLRRLRPISDRFGFDRGLPIDRYYIERFLTSHASKGDIRGRVLEIKEDLYASRFGAASDIEAVDVLDVDTTNANATVYADLTESNAVPENSFDCVICTQTLHIIYDFRAALSSLHAALRPKGVLLVTVPGITRGCTPAEARADHWRFTSASVRLAFEERFAGQDVSVEAYGNVLAAAAFLFGLAAEELRPSELDFRDERYEVLLGIRAVKRG